MPQISVIVPVYNAEQFIADCIESILTQSYTEFELLLIDDGSKDKSGMICDAYAEKDPRVRVIHKENGGVSSARNLGLSIATGEYVTFVDSDDWIDQEFLKKGIQACQRDNLDMYLAGFVRVYPNGRMQESCISESVEGYSDELNEKSYSEFLMNNYSAHTAGKLIRRVIAQSRAFNNRYSWGEDTSYIYSLLNQHLKIKAVEDQAYFYRVGHSSLVSSITARKCQHFSEGYQMLYAWGEQRGFDTEGEYHHFLDTRFFEDLLYFERLILETRIGMTEKRKMLKIILQVPGVSDQITKKECVRHVRLYGKRPSLLILRHHVQFVNKWIRR